MDRPLRLAGKDIENQDFNPPSSSSSSQPLKITKTKSIPRNSNTNNGGCEIEKSDDQQQINIQGHSNNSTTPTRAVGTRNSTVKKVWNKLIYYGFALFMVLKVISIILFAILSLVPLLLKSVYSAWFLDNVIGNDEKIDENSKRGIFTKTVKYRTSVQQISNKYLVLMIRLGCVFLAWLPVTLYVRWLKESTVLGSAHWKWTLFALTLLWMYIITRLVIVFIVDLEIIGTKKMFKKKFRVEYYIDGLQLSFITCLSIGLALVVWLTYFRSGNGLKKDSLSAGDEKMLAYGTWTLVSLFVGAILWVVKTSLLLNWKAKAVYCRFKSNILVAGFQLYFLTLITDGQRCSREALIPWWDGELPPNIDGDNSNKQYQDTMNSEAIDNRKLNHVKFRGHQQMRSNMLNQQVTLLQLKTGARWVRDLAKVVTIREDDSTEELETEWRIKIGENISLDSMMRKSYLQNGFHLDRTDVELLYAELLTQNHFDEERITYGKFIKWMVDSHKNCLTVGYTLVDSEAVAESLNLVMKFAIVIIVIFLWLLITELATTKFLVLIATPILALSFMFGDTTKSFFQGVIFTFVTHPFDVGDHCIIDGTEMEVEKIGILTTMFKRMGSNGHVLYPNSELAIKSIINLHGQPDPRDELELELDYVAGRIRTSNLLNKIEEFIRNNKDLYESDHLVMVKVIRDKIKIIVQFTHKMGNNDITHSQYFQKKSKQCSHLFTAMLDIIED